MQAPCPDNAAASAARPCLIIVRAGKHSLSLTWDLPEDRCWDLVTLAYDDAVLDDDQWTVGDLLVDSRSEPTKYFGIQRFIEDHPETLDREAVMMVDDDLLMDPGQLNRLFELFKASGALLGQPALTWNSYHSHFVTLQNRAFLWRYTNFTEVMTPIMTGAFLRQVLPSFRATRSAWGLDYLWAALCREIGESIAIIDGVPVQHTRPLGGGGLYERLGVDPREEMQQLLATFQIVAPPGMVLGGRLDPDFGAPRSNSLLESFVAGMDPQLCRLPGFLPVLQASLPHLTQPLH